MTEKLYQDNSRTIYCGDARAMAEVPDNSAQCVVTSPPYWGKRKYAGEQELVWGDNLCQHQWGAARARSAHPDRSTGDHDQIGSGIFVDRIPRGDQSAKAARGQAVEFGTFCSLCGAWKGSFGLEPVPEMYVEHSIEILREIRRLLRKDGVVFWNIGDSYAGGKGTCLNPGGGKGAFSTHGRRKDAGAYPLDRGNVLRLKASGLKPKDLCLIPFRIAIAAQEDGWWVRSVIIWSKNNPMPESVKDRPSDGHEYILMLTKSERYYWDQEAVRMPLADTSIARGPVDFGGKKGRDYKPRPDDPNYRHGNEQWGRTTEYREGGRNLRSVWTFATQPYPEAHFAVFPEKLPEMCIKAATPEVGCCSECGAPWKRLVDKQVLYRRGKSDNEKYPIKPVDGNPGVDVRFDHDNVTERRTIGWKPSCKCNAHRVPSVVLDPFMGAGTTLLIGAKLGRRAIGYDISHEYCQLAINRNKQMVL